MVNKNMKVADVMKLDSNLAQVFIRFGMLCYSCPFASQETIEQAAPEHGIDTDELVKALNEYLENK